jgi:hypothetical protein
MKLKENDNIPNSEFFIMEDGNPIKKIRMNFIRIKKLFFLVYQVHIHPFVQLNTCLDM